MALFPLPLGRRTKRWDIGVIVVTMNNGVIIMTNKEEFDVSQHREILQILFIGEKEYERIEIDEIHGDWEVKSMNADGLIILKHRREYQHFEMIPLANIKRIFKYWVPIEEQISTVDRLD
jgi:hypothetical protein